jgi:hypothetical protein
MSKRSNGSEALGCKVTGPFGTGKSYGVSALLITSLFRQGGEVLFRLEQGGTRGCFSKRF